MSIETYILTREAELEDFILECRKEIRKAGGEDCDSIYEAMGKAEKELEALFATGVWCAS